MRRIAYIGLSIAPVRRGAYAGRPTSAVGGGSGSRVALTGTGVGVRGGLPKVLAAVDGLAFGTEEAIISVVASRGVTSRSPAGAGDRVRSPVVHARSALAAMPWWP